MVNTAHRAATALGLLCGTWLLAACSSAPPATDAATPRVVEHAHASALTPVTPQLALPAGWSAIESKAVSIDANDVLFRIRLGFSLDDHDARAIDVEESWYAKHPEYLDRTFRRAERYLYHIVNELEARKMPLELALLPVVESAFNPEAYSHAKAAGLWQFIPATGTRFGLKRNLYYDGRLDVTESTRAALDYLQFLHDEFDGDWLLAVAGYNCGEMNVARAIARNRAKGKPTDFFSLDLPRETEAYVPKLLAMKRIVEDPARYGLSFGVISNQPYFAKVNVGGQIDMRVAAQLADMEENELKAINPGYRRVITDPNGSHELLIPVAKQSLFLDRLGALPASERAPTVIYRVKRGDTLNKIAQRYGMDVADIRALNSLKRNGVKPGQELLLRGVSQADLARIVAQTPELTRDSGPSRSSAKGKTHTVKSGETLWSIAQRYDLDPSVLASINHVRGNAIKAGQKLKIPGAAATNLQASNTRRTAAEHVTYKVKRGDTLSQIANQFQVDVKQVMSWNNLRSSSAIKTGQKLRIYMDDRTGG